MGELVRRKPQHVNALAELPEDVVRSQPKAASRYRSVIDAKHYTWARENLTEDLWQPTKVGAYIAAHAAPGGLLLAILVYATGLHVLAMDTILAGVGGSLLSMVGGLGLSQRKRVRVHRLDAAVHARLTASLRTWVRERYGLEPTPEAFTNVEDILAERAASHPFRTVDGDAYYLVSERVGGGLQYTVQAEGTDMELSEVPLAVAATDIKQAMTDADQDVLPADLCKRFYALAGRVQVLMQGKGAPEQQRAADRLGEDLLHLVGTVRQAARHNGLGPAGQAAFAETLDLVEQDVTAIEGAGQAALAREAEAYTEYMRERRRLD